MCTTEPIRNKTDMRKLVKYFEETGQTRNCAMVTLGFATALRITDELNLTWGDVYDFERNCFRTHFEIRERKTGKPKQVKINQYCKDVLKKLMKENNEQKGPVAAENYIFSNGRMKENHISRVQAWRIIKRAVNTLAIQGNIACHSLRKTFGYYAWKYLKKSAAVIMEIYNHCSFAVTKRYLGITQDDLDLAYCRMRMF